MYSLIPKGTFLKTCFFSTGCLFSRESEDGRNHFPTDQTHRLSAGQNGPTHQKEKGLEKSLK